MSEDWIKQMTRTRTRLRRLAAKYETATFVDGDPIRFLHTASGPGVETMAFVAACLSYGSRKQDCSSACKRLCLFLRWMVRDGSPVDYGLWSDWFDKSTLIVPLDVHVLRQARNLRLIRTNAATMHTALEITARLAEAFPGDPCRGDFALYGLGIDEES